MADVARAAGMSAGNLYWYFPSKEDLLKEVLASGFGSLTSMTARVASAPDPPAARLRLLVAETQRLYEDQQEFMTVLLSTLENGPESVAELGFDMQAIGAGYHDNLRPLFEEARAAGIVADLPADLLIAFYFSLFNGLLITYTDLWPQLPPSAIAGAVLGAIGFKEKLG